MLREFKCWEQATAHILMDLGWRQCICCMWLLLQPLGLHMEASPNCRCASWAWMGKGGREKISCCSSKSQSWDAPHPFKDTIHWSYMCISNMRKKWKLLTHSKFSMLPAQFSDIYSALQKLPYIEITSAVNFYANDDGNCLHVIFFRSLQTCE